MAHETFDQFRNNNPHLEDFLTLLDHLNKESPRGQVLVCCSLLEEQLRRILLCFFLDDPLHGSLVDGANAPLGTFSSRINACHALALITDDERNDLDQMRKIRNEFAHNLKASFENQNIKDRSANLRFRAQDYKSEALGDVVVSAQGQFSTAATALVLSLVNRPHYVSQKRRVQTEWKR